MCDVFNNEKRNSMNQEPGVIKEGQTEKAQTELELNKEVNKEAPKAAETEKPNQEEPKAE